MNVTEYRSLIAAAKWRAARSMTSDLLSDSWREWLMHRGSLTAKLTDFAHGEFSLRVLSEEWGTPTCYESTKLGLKLPVWAMIREVELSCKGKPTVYARSIIPKDVYQENKNTLATMGGKPLGHFLSRSALLQPSARDICELNLASSESGIESRSGESRSGESRSGESRSGESRSGESSYGRATLYNYNAGTILVQEFFIDPALVT